MNNSFFQDIWAQRKAWLLFIPFMLFYAASYFQRTAIPGTTFTIFQSTYGLNAAEIAGLASSFVLVYSFCQLLVGMLADKFGGLRLVTVAGAIFCVGVLGFPFSCGNLTLMYICRFLTGLGASTLYLSLVKESERIFGRKNFAVILGIIYFIGYGGGLFGTLPFALFCEKFKWIPLLISVGVISTLLYLWFLAARKCVPISPIKKTTQFFLQPLFSIIKNPLSWMIVYCSSVNFACNSVIQMIFGKKMLQDTAGIDDTGAAAVIFFQVLVCMFALLSGGIQTRITRNRRKPLMIFSTVLALLNTLMMYAAIRFHLPQAFLVAGFLIYAMASGFSIAFSLACQEVNNRSNIAQSSGFCNFMNYLFIAVFSPLIGKLLNIFASEEAQQGSVASYSPEAYQLLFAVLLIPTVISVQLTFFIPETRGHFLKRNTPIHEK